MNTRKIYAPANYDEMKVGETLEDLYFKSTWLVIERTRKGAVLRNAASEDRGVKLTVEPETCSLAFQTVA